MTFRIRPYALPAALATGLLLALPAQAQGFKPVIGAGVTAGGETLVTVRYTDGSSQNIKSGGLLHLFGGVEYDAPTYAVQANIGYHVADTNASNGSVKFARYPVELLGFWKLNDTWRLGGGLRKSTGARVTSSGAASSVGGTDFDAKAGSVLQLEYLNAGFGVYGRFVSETYTVRRVDVDGNHVGLGISYRF